jgi:uncharacterized protein (TIGR03435 family)
LYVQEIQMKKPLFAIVLVAAVVPLSATAQSPGPSSPDREVNLPAFEVVSVKENRSNAAGHRMQYRPDGRVMVTNAPLRVLVETAYGLLPQHLTGGPGWLDSARFDIVAKAGQNLPPSAPGGPPGPAQLMLQRLLAERFKLVVRGERRELQIYALTVARDDGRLGPAISAAKADCAALMAAYGRGAAPPPPQSECGITGAPGRVSGRGAIMAMFARGVLAAAVEHIVEDRTGLIGGFDFDLEFSVDSGVAAGTTLGPASASIFTALEEQLGLKLRPVRAPVDVLVIDRVERPTED